MRLIDADALEMKMYHDAFETDSDMQKWESGCWIRYKLFENNIDNTPTIDAVEVVRCKDCQYHEWCIPKQGRTENDYCSRGKRRDDDESRNKTSGE